MFLFPLGLVSAYLLWLLRFFYLVSVPPFTKMSVLRIRNDLFLRFSRFCLVKLGLRIGTGAVEYI